MVKVHKSEVFNLRKRRVTLILTLLKYLYWKKNFSGTCLYVNTRYKKYKGYRQEETVKQRLYDILVTIVKNTRRKDEVQ